MRIPKPNKCLKSGHPDLERAWQSLPGGPTSHPLSTWKPKALWVLRGVFKARVLCYTIRKKDARNSPGDTPVEAGFL